ncbi:MAG: hypothetical protein FJ405_02765 [Verrucomicrobia bacterium]|nr:hypothetical protein [Verrucomicrobiota bacterium]
MPDSAVIHARVLAGPQWSALTHATFFTPQDYSKLRLTEIMYHPLESGASVEEAEFIELKNTGANTLVLEGASFAEGINFTFPRGTLLRPGEFAVLARDRARFEAAYPGVPIAGVYDGQLDNGGETLRLISPVQSEVWSVTYGDAPLWPVTPDGYGFSLVPRETDAEGDPRHAWHWRASTEQGGSPGADDPPSLIPPVVINEILTATTPPFVDTIELFNPTGTAVDVSGWFLTDDPALPRKFSLPNGSLLMSGGFLLFNESHFNPVPATTNNFALSSRGEQVHLFSADANGGLTGYDHGFRFGAAEAGVTFGRLVLSTGQENFPAQLTRTDRAPNAGPRIGPVVINEIHYHPASGDSGFIELKNIAADRVLLADAAGSTNTWRVNGIDFDFPPDTTLAPGELLLIVAVDPVTFRARHGLPQAARILGPFGGNLQNNGERLALQRPGPLDTQGFAYVTVDEVRYEDRTPWPDAADGTGASLHRLAGPLYGNEPQHWVAARPSPGVEYSGGSPPVITRPPTAVTTVAYLEAQFRVGAAGPPPLSYQWRFNGAALPGATNEVLRISSVKPTDVGAYSVVVFNTAGSAVSAGAPLTVRLPALITEHPRSRSATNGGTGVFSVTARGQGRLRYQWVFNGADLPGATNATLTLRNIAQAQAGAYVVVVTDDVGATPSRPATLTVYERPTILTPPRPQAVVSGGTATFTVMASGTLPLTYRWRRNDVTLTNIVLRSNVGTFTLANIRSTDAGNYSVVVTNLLGASLPSASALLTVLADTDGDLMADEWELAFGLDPNSPRDAALDLDGDGVSNREEYLAGTNPKNALSYLKVDRISVTPSTMLQFLAISNRTYTVQFKDALDALAWSKLTDIPAHATNRIEIVIDLDRSSSQRFYRLATPATP